MNNASYDVTDHYTHWVLDGLLDEPGHAFELLCWLLDGPLSFDQLVTYRSAALLTSTDLDPVVVDDFALRSVLLDLVAARMYVSHEGALFTLEDGVVGPLVLYRRVAEQSHGHRLRRPQSSSGQEAAA